MRALFARLLELKNTIIALSPPIVAFSGVETESLTYFKPNLTYVSSGAFFIGKRGSGAISTITPPCKTSKTAEALSEIRTSANSFGVNNVPFSKRKSSL